MSGGRAVIVSHLLPPPAYRVWALHRLTRPEWLPERWSQVRWTGRYWVFHRGHDEHHRSPADAAACGWVYLAPVSLLDGKGRVARHLNAGQRVAAQRQRDAGLFADLGGGAQP